MASRLSFQCPLDPQKRNPDMRSLLFSKVLVNEPLQVTQQGPYGESCPPAEPSFTRPPGSLVKEPSLQVPLIELFRRELPACRAFLYTSSRVPSKGTIPPRSPHRAPSERYAPFLELSFLHLSTSPGYEPPSRIPIGAPMERDAHLQSLPLRVLQGPQ
jgi:hypothetical protein